jgi:hypothetical protein
MGWFGKLFGSQQPRTMLDEVRNASAPIIVSRYRALGNAAGCAPTSATTDDEILAIYSAISAAFREASKRRGEHISAGNLNVIAWKFMQVKEQFGQPFFNEHLEYELAKYLGEGLRPDYQQELSLFDI